MKRRRDFTASLRWAWNGLVYAMKTERHMRIHLTATVLVLIASWWLAISRLEMVAVLLAIGLVVTSELLNTAIEATVDLITQEQNETAKIAKDVSAGAVLAAAIIAVVVGLYVFIPPLIAKIGLAV